MSIPYVEYTVNGGETEFPISFPYLNPTHLRVELNGATMGFSVEAGTVRIAGGLQMGGLLVLRRETPIDEAAVTFTNGAVLTQEDLNTAVLQLLFAQQEASAYLYAKLRSAQVRLAEANGLPTNPTAVGDALAQMVLGSDILAEFSSRIIDIEINAQAIIAELSARIIDIEHNAEAIIAEAAARAGLESTVAAQALELIATNNAIAAEVLARTGLATALGTTQAALTTETTARIDGDTALASSITTLTAAVSTAEADFAAAIHTEQVARADAISAEASARTAIVAAFEDAITDTVALITTEQTARIDDVEALATEINEVRVIAEAGGGEAGVAIAEEATARITEDAALGERIDTVSATLTTTATAIFAAIDDETSARVTAVAAEAASRETLQARFGAMEKSAPFRETFETYTGLAGASGAGWFVGGTWTFQDGSVGKALELTSPTELYTSRTFPVNDQDTYCVSLTVETDVTNVGPMTVYAGFRSANSSGTFLNGTDAGSFHNTAAHAESISPGTRKVLKGYFKGLKASGAGHGVGLVAPNPRAPSPMQEGTAAVSPFVLAYGTAGLKLLVHDVSIYPVSEVAALDAGLFSEQTARASADAALATSISGVVAQATTDRNAASAAILDEQTARASADAALATSISGVVAQATTDRTNANSAILAEQTARAEADAAEANARTALAATLNGNITSAVLAEQTARTDADGALASTIAGVIAQATTDRTNANSAILAEQTARADADAAEANARTALAATLNGNITSAIAAERGVRVSAEDAIAYDVAILNTNLGSLSSTVSTISTAVAGVGSRWGVAVDVNGRVAGILLNNSAGSPTSFEVYADRFAIVDPADPAGVSPVFEVVGGVTRIRNAVIGNANVGTPNLMAGAVTSLQGVSVLGQVALSYQPSAGRDSDAGASYTITYPTGGPVRLDYGAFVINETTGQGTGTGFTPMLVRIQNGVTTDLAGVFGLGSVDFYIDVPAAGYPVTYKLHYINMLDAGSASVTNQRIYLTEFKR